MIPYGKQTVDQQDIDAVTAVLKSDWLTQGPKIAEFEAALADYCGAKYAVVFANGTLALEGAYSAAGLAAGDEIITTPITFPATSNAARIFGAKIIFADVEAATGNLDPKKIEPLINNKTKILAPVDYTGRPIDLKAFRDLAKKHNLIIVEDACQALGASYGKAKIGALSDLTVFSFHPVKTITTGEGGAVLTNNEVLYKKLKMYVTHGISRDNFVHQSPGPWYFEMQFLGQNARLTDFQCALGLSQLKKADSFVAARRDRATYYSEKLSGIVQIITPPPDNANSHSAWHLYVINLKPPYVSRRKELITWLREQGVMAQVHHYPVYWHPYYEALGYQRGLCPVAESFYDSAVTLPLYPKLTKQDQDVVIDLLHKFFST